MTCGSQEHSSCNDQTHKASQSQHATQHAPHKITSDHICVERYCKAIYIQYVVSVTHTYMHLRVKFLCRRPGFIRPGDVIHAKIVGAVGSVPHIVAVRPRQDGGERGIEVEEGPGDDGVVVEGHIEGNDTNGISYT